MKKLALILVVGLLPYIALAQQSQWVHRDKNGKLVYKTTPRGDRIMDFSDAGYMGGGVALPNVPVKETVKPSGTDDDCKQIQAAIDRVAKLPLVNGHRGTVLLAPGVFTCPKSIIIAANGVVLRGSGDGLDGTTIKMTGDKHTAIVIGRNNTDVALGSKEQADDNEYNDVKTAMAGSYVPAGVKTFPVENAKGFAVGDTIIIRRPVTDAWLHLMRMDDLVRDGKPQTWISKKAQEIVRRKIIAIKGNQLTVNISLPDSYDMKYLGAGSVSVSKARPANRITQVGVERLRIECPPLEIDYAHAPYAAIRVGGDDCWVRDVYCHETMNSTVLAGNRITMQRVIIRHTFPNLGASKPADFSLEGSQNLIDRCQATGGNTYFVWTSSFITGPNVLLNCVFAGIGSRIQPHQRWSTGLLVDNCTMADGNIDFMNRGVAGSGHGWTMAWAVAWNCAGQYIIQMPPGAANWAIGCIGTRQQTARLFDSTPIEPEGYFDSHNKPVNIPSLYLEQLKERLGIKGLKNIGYQNNLAAQFDYKKHVKPTLFFPPYHKGMETDLAYSRPVNTSGVRGAGREFGGEKALDDDPKTYWALNDGVTKGTFEMDMEGPVDINALKISEALGDRITDYKIEAQVNSDWVLLASGKHMGKDLVANFPKVTVWKVKLTVLNATDYPAVSGFSLYLKK